MRVKFLYDLPKGFIPGRYFKAGEIEELSNRNTGRVLNAGYATLNIKAEVEASGEKGAEMLEVPDFNKMIKSAIVTWAEMNLDMTLDPETLKKDMVNEIQEKIREIS